MFFCGPKVLSEVLHKVSNAHSNIGGDGAKILLQQRKLLVVFTWDTSVNGLHHLTSMHLC